MKSERVQFTNARMSLLLTKHDIAINHAELDKGLANILERGFIRLGDGVFFRKFTDSNEIYFATDSFGQYSNLSGYENTINRFHIDDFSQTDCFIQAFVFLRYFKSHWKSCHPSLPCNICISFQNDNFFTSTTFSFHVQRINEVVYDMRQIDTFNDAVYFEKIY